MATPTANTATATAQANKTATANPAQTGTANSTAGAAIKAPAIAPDEKKPEQAPAATAKAAKRTKPAATAKAESQAQEKDESEKTATANIRTVMVLTNCTDTARGISLTGGIKNLEGREMWTVPEMQKDEIRALFKSRTFQRFIDNDIFRLSEIGDDEQSAVVKTPEPPANLTESPIIESLGGKVVGTNSGSLAKSPEVVEYQQGGPLPEENTGRA